MADVTIGEADIQVEADTSNFDGDLRRSIRDLGGQVGGLKGMFSNLGESFSGVAAGMKGNIVMIAVALSLLPAAGALAALGIVAAFGGAFTAIGLMAAKSNKGVQKEMEGLKKHVGKVMKDISKPFVQTWHTILGTARDVFDTFAPELEKAFKVIAPVISQVVRDVGEGLKSLAPAIKPMADAFSAVLKAISPAIKPMMDEIAASLIEIANVVKENPELFASFVTGLMKIIPWGLKLIEVLAKLFVWISDLMGTTNAFVTILGLLFTPLVIAKALFDQFMQTFEQAKPAMISWWTTAQEVFQGIWSTVTEVFTSIWNTITMVVGFITNIITTGFNLIKTIVQSVFNLIKAIIFGDFEQVKAIFHAGVAAISAAWTAFWNAVKSAASAAWNAIKAIFSAAWNAIKATASAAWGAIKGLFSSGMNTAKSIFTSGWNALRSGAISGASNLLGIVRSIPGRIRSALGDLAGLLVNAGRNVVLGLISGIRSMFGHLMSIASEMASKIRNVLPFSPAKTGPLAGSGSPEIAGGKIAKMIADGMKGGTGAVTRAAAGLADAASIRLPGTDAARAQGGAAGLLWGLSGGGGMAALQEAIREGSRQGVMEGLEGRVGNTIVLERARGTDGESSDDVAQRLRSLSELGAI